MHSPARPSAELPAKPLPLPWNLVMFHVGPREVTYSSGAFRLPLDHLVVRPHRPGNRTATQGKDLALVPFQSLADMQCLSSVGAANQTQFNNGTRAQ